MRLIHYPQQSITEVISVGEVQKKRIRLQVSCFRENIGEEEKTCLQAYIFDNGVTLPTEESRITPGLVIYPRVGNYSFKKNWNYGTSGAI